MLNKRRWYWTGNRWLQQLANPEITIRRRNEEDPIIELSFHVSGSALAGVMHRTNST
jgi:hypothetical protein